MRAIIFHSRDAGDHLSRDASNHDSVDASDHDSVDASDHDSVDASDRDSLVCAHLLEWPKTIAIFGEGATDDDVLQLCPVGHPLFSSIKIILMLFFERRLSEARQR